MTKWVVDAKDITKVYQMGEVEVHALRGLSVKIAPGEVLSIMGPSGSGKSTLMNILGCLDRPTSGEYSLNGKPGSRFCLSKLQSSSQTNRSSQRGTAHALRGIKRAEP